MKKVLLVNVAYYDERIEQITVLIDDKGHLNAYTASTSLTTGYLQISPNSVLSKALFKRIAEHGRKVEFLTYFSYSQIEKVTQ